jgi:hypothetical protein
MTYVSHHDELRNSSLCDDLRNYATMNYVSLHVHLRKLINYLRMLTRRLT